MARDGRATLREIFAVMRDRSLSVEEKVLWALLRSHETPEKGAYPGDERLAAMIDRSPRSVQRYRRKLLNRGYLDQKLRGPKPATYRAVLPPERPGTDGEASTERDDTGGDSSPRRDDMGGDPSSPERADTSAEPCKASPTDPPNDSPSDPPPVSPEYGEYGEDGEGTETEGSSSLRSSDPSGASADGENLQERRSRVGPPTGEYLLAGGEERIAAWILPLHRDLLYPPDGRPPQDYDDARDVTVYRSLLERGHSPEAIERSLEGLAHARDTGKLEWLDPGEKATARALRAGLPGGLNALVRFACIGRRLRAGELGEGESNGGGPQRISSLLAEFVARGSTSASEDDG